MLSNVRVVAEGLRFPEGPVALPDGDVLVVEMAASAVTRVHVDGTKTVVAEIRGCPNGAAVGPDGRLYLCNNGGTQLRHTGDGYEFTGMQPPDYIGGRIQALDLVTGAVEDVYVECNGVPLRAPNDLVFDAFGGFWFTDHGKGRPRDFDQGAVYYATADGSSIREIIHPLMQPNGIGLSLHGDAIVFSETQRARVYRIPLSAPGMIDAAEEPMALSTRWILGAVPTQSLFDSLAVDAEGNVLVGTLFRHAGVTEIDSATGEVTHHVLEGDLADPYVTNVCFGGPDLTTLYITCSKYGRLLACDWPKPGTPLNFLNDRSGTDVFDSAEDLSG